MKGWQRVYSTPKGYLAEILHGMLTSAGVDNVVINKQDSNYLTGFYEIYVANENALHAINLVERETTES